MLIVSMAVIASRVHNIPAIITNLQRQSRPPDKILLYHSKEPWHHDSGISDLILPPSSLDVEVVTVPNRGSCRKYLFTAERYRSSDASILLLDDDHTWHRRVIETLGDYHNRFRRVVGTRGWSQFDFVRDAGTGEERLSHGKACTVVGSDLFRPREVGVTSSGWATMFYAKDVDGRLFDQELQQSVELGYSDEVFLAAMLPREKYVIPMPRGFARELETPTALYRAPETARAKARQIMLLCGQCRSPITSASNMTLDTAFTTSTTALQ